MRLVEQCAMRMPGCGDHTLLCIREVGHEGAHKNYTGRWDSTAEFRSTDPPYMLPERTPPQVSDSQERKTP